MRWCLVLVTLVVGCVDTTQIECGDGKVCPANYTCVDFGCASVEQVAACDGKSVDEACSTSLGAGMCRDSACFVPRCGNGVMEGPEVCDDGNEQSGDGCNGTCTSDESCGNGITELGEGCDCGTEAGEGEPISLCNGTLNGGAVCRDDCALHRCGDGMVAPGEVCDDGNTEGGDGCNPDCSSDETCGNDILDFFADEQCDDANLRPGDGCSTSCTVEVGEWQLHDQIAVPVGRRSHAMAFDTDLGRTIMFGGIVSGGRSAETWALEGETWRQIFSDTVPAARDSPQLAYDATRHRVVLFGGGTPAGDINDTWELDGNTWTQIFPTTSPSGRIGAAIAYDPRRGKIVLVGGLDQSFTKLADVWEYNGTTWTQLTTSNPPPARYGAAMVYDPVNNRLVLSTGQGASATLGDTWALSGTTWTQISSSPGQRFNANMVFDTATGRINIFGGSLGSSQLADQRELVNGTWQARSTSNTPLARTVFGMTHDPHTGLTYLFGGFNSSDTFIDDTSVLSGSAWTTIVTTAAPDTRSDTALAYDSRRGRILMYGGDRTNASDDDNWSFDGVKWRTFYPSTYVGERLGHGFAYDSARDRVVMFGGQAYTAGTYMQTTWEFDGTDWLLRTPSTSPTARAAMGMVYDSRRGKTVLFGGTSDLLDYATTFGDTWEYNGTTWTQTASSGPAARARVGMAYDPVRDRVILFGGVSATVEHGDTWEYNGTTSTWTQLQPAVSPPARRGTQLTYDASRNKIVLFGGMGTSGELFHDMWELDFTVPAGSTTSVPTWRPVSVSQLNARPSQREAHALAFDIAHDTLVLFGGAAVSGQQSDTWLFAPRADVRDRCDGTDLDEDNKLGCADDECWTVCSPACSPFTPMATCPASPRCGDGVCSPVESCHSCIADCPLNSGTCPVRCGDGFCNAPETTSSCPGDCP